MMPKVPSGRRDLPDSFAQTIWRITMRFLERLFRLSPSNQDKRHRRRTRLSLENLETRLAPANVFVVPLTQQTDSTHFFSLQEAAPRQETVAS
jgi:hypothetical protein